MTYLVGAAAAMEWGRGAWRPPDLKEDARGGGVAGSMEGRGGGLLVSPWSGGSGRHVVGGEGHGHSDGEEAS